MELYCLNPFLRYAGIHTRATERGRVSVCYDCRFFFIIEGAGSISADGEKYELSENTAVYLPSGTHYSFDMSGAVRIAVLDFDLTSENTDKRHSLSTATEGSIDESRFIRESVPDELGEAAVKGDSHSLGEHILRCTELFMTKPDYYEHIASAELKLALIGLLGERRSERAEYRLVTRVMEYVRESFAQPTLTNKTVASHFGYHPYYLSRLMREHSGKTLHAYVCSYRLRMARSFLTTTDMSVTEIAERCGFSSYTYFIKLFREREGISPLQYRKRSRGAEF